jgi:hypothetical protein
MTQFAVGRIVKIVNTAIAALLAVALAAVYWFAWRPLPQRSGPIDAPLGAGASVSFDTLGEPHIRAATLDDALFVQGSSPTATPGASASAASPKKPTKPCPATTARRLRLMLAA